MRPACRQRSQPGTPTNRLPSYRAMCELATQDPDVSALMSQERYQEAVKDFEGVEATNDTEPANWMDRLEINSQTGLPKATIDNVWIILENSLGCTLQKMPTASL